MKKLKLARVMAITLAVASILTLNPIGASAEWKQDSTGWWYTEGSSWATGWRLINGNWYYFYSNGYMARNITIGGYYLDSSGVWNNSASTQAKVTLSDVDYCNKMADIYTRLEAWDNGFKGIVNKVYSDNSYVLSDEFKQSMASKKTEIDAIYNDACSLNPSDTFKAVNNSVIGFIKDFDDGMTLYNDGLSERNVTKLKQADELMKEGSAESYKTVEIINALKAKLNK